MKRLSFIFVALLIVGLMGCSHNINTLSDNYATSSAAVKHFAEITAGDWLFGSGIIQGAIPESAVPAWVFAELRKVDEWAERGEFTEWELGYMIGARFRLTGPVIKSAIEQYAPQLLGINQVTAVLAFLGL